ncbi:uncharacterized protein LOC120359263 [Solenopsis invicta]|uniref:uncharacterized protein LOC120358307 n=1 Tax=Solenopsis invicta TaxID=13686 RepID=UPI00193E2417|nr:uncharacterized protein LOC120358307 [Solenopsis invicta]XP_039312052.1 uncharacterized protein LOC120359263 [Solenopsis invicta]
MANYYVPTEAREKASSNIRYTPRILGRRFALTSTSYKWIDVAINVGSVSCSVEISLGDTRGNRIVLPYRTWRALLDKRADFERFVQSTEAPSLPIHDLTVQLVKLRDESIVKLSLLDACIYLKPTTMLFMFELEHCVEHVYYTLHQSIATATEKFKYFVTFLRQNFAMNKPDATELLRKSYDKSSQIECELIAYAIDTIIYDALTT